MTTFPSRLTPPQHEIIEIALPQRRHIANLQRRHVTSLCPRCLAHRQSAPPDHLPIGVVSRLVAVAEIDSSSHHSGGPKQSVSARTGWSHI